MKTTKLFITAGTVLLLCGCATYDKPPVSVAGSSYTQMKEEERKAFPEDLQVLTLEKAQQMALLRNPNFRSMQFSVNAARARYYQSFSSYAPTVNAGMSIQQGFTKMFSGENSEHYRSQSESYRPSLSGSWLLFDCLGREMNVLEKKYTLHQSEALEDDAKRLLLRAVAYAYNDVQLSYAQKAIAVAQIDYADKMLKDSEYKYKAGSVPLSDVLNFRISLRNGKLTLRDCEYNIQATKYVLAGYLGLLEGTIPDRITFPEVKFPEIEFLPDVSVFLDMALVNRPDLRGFRDSLQAKKYAYYGTLAKFGPTVSTFYSLSYDSSRNIHHGDNDNWSRSRTGNFNYGLTASWNLFNGFDDYFNAKAALAEMAKADYQLAEGWISVITDVRSAYENLKNQSDQAVLSKEIYELTLKTRNIVESEYKTGTAEVTRLNEAQRALILAQHTLASSVINISNAKAQLDAAVAMPDQGSAAMAEAASDNTKNTVKGNHKK